MSIYITTEETADVPASLVMPNSAILPMCFTVCGKEFDGKDKKLSPKEFYDVCRQAKSAQDLPTTSMINSYEAQEFFRPILQQGNDIIHIGFSEKLSGMFDQIMIAQKELSKEFPQRKIVVINSKMASFVEGMLFYFTCQKRDSGATFDQIVAYAEEMKLRVGARFIVDDLKHLYRTGRASKSQAYFGEKLQIKPILYLNGNGELIPIAKAMSRRKAIKEMLDMIDEDMLPIEQQSMIAVGHADCEDDAKKLIEMIKEKYNFQNVILYDVGAVIGSHVGAGMMSVIYQCKSR
ncbi:MAG: DegV family protein, partial [Clostridia bacterium]